MQALTAKNRAKNNLTEKCARCGEIMEDVISGRSIEYTESQQAGFRLQGKGRESSDLYLCTPGSGNRAGQAGICAYIR